VLSDATREYDRGQKFTLYKEIPTLREYVLVEQSAVLVEAFRYVGGNWMPQNYATLDAAMTFESLGLSMPVREIYRQVF
jgi:Uma2 family endonuclease